MLRNELFRKTNVSKQNNNEIELVKILMSFFFTRQTANSLPEPGLHSIS